MQHFRFDFQRWEGLVCLAVTDLHYGVRGGETWFNFRLDNSFLSDVLAVNTRRHNT